MALYAREKRGHGEVVDVALYEPLMFILGDLILKYESLGEIQERIGNGTGSASPRGVYMAADGRWLAIAASNQTIAKRLFAAMGQPELIDDPRFSSNGARMANNDAIQAKVTAWVASMARDDALEVLDRYEVVASPVNDARDIVADPHFRERTLVELTGTKALGNVLMPGPVLHFGRNPQRPVYEGVPGIGEHTAEVLGELHGLSGPSLADLESRGVVGLA